MIGLLGASQYEPIVENLDERTIVSTRFGDVSVLKGRISDNTVFFIRRFGWHDNKASDVVNHAAHTLAFRMLGVRRVITLNGFGGVNHDFNVGDLVVYHDYVKMLERGPTTIFFGEQRWPRANMTDPFCTEIRETLINSARYNSNRNLHTMAVNICVQGPHNETPAEFEAFRRLGADIVSTAIYPEVVYYRELEMCFAGLSWITDSGSDNDEKNWVRIGVDELSSIVREAIKNIPDVSNCRCQSTWIGNESDHYNDTTSLPSWYLDIR
ncbi:MAG: hypothetical protein CL781_07295 [Chloroflexi bacterium]|nr:hypothetical protein [Chloroflexota bacterium]MBI51110.1 hypothetical protein [Chloroflexota bacterium]|tara:strand:+ start:174 stop:977 length:804 start_codon:yes stop_codon:yes gene_type:complete